MPLWLGGEDVRCCIRVRELMDQMRKAFQAVAQQDEPNRITSQRTMLGLSMIEGAPTNASAMILAPGFLPGIRAYTVKVHAKYPDNIKNGMPSIQGVIQLFDSRNGELLAIIDSPIVTAYRTAAAAMVATDTLARLDSHAVAIIGAGVQGNVQLRYLREIRDIERVFVVDVDDGRARIYAERLTQEGLNCVVASSVREAASSADIIILATWARSPVLYSNMVRPGTHITTIGADEPGKVEVAQDLMLVGRAFCDDREMAERMGMLNTFSERNEMQLVTLGEVLAGRQTGRQSDADITIFGGVGLPFQDLVGAWHVYGQALASGIGIRL